MIGGGGSSKDGGGGHAPQLAGGAPLSHGGAGGGNQIVGLGGRGALVKLGPTIGKKCSKHNKELTWMARVGVALCGLPDYLALWGRCQIPPTQLAQLLRSILYHQFRSNRNKLCSVCQVQYSAPT